MLSSREQIENPPFEKLQEISSSGHDNHASHYHSGNCGDTAFRPRSPITVRDLKIDITNEMIPYWYLSFFANELECLTPNRVEVCHRCYIITSVISLSAASIMTSVGVRIKLFQVSSCISNSYAKYHKAVTPSNELAMGALLFQ